MKSKLTILTAILVLTAAAAAHSQSLADLAKKEKERRAKVQAEANVITNKDVSMYKGGALTVNSDPSRSSGKESAARSGEGGITTTAEISGSDEPVDFFGRTESFWRQTFSDATRKVSELEAKANVLKLRIAELQTSFYSEDNGFKQQEIQREIQKTIYEQDQNTEALDKARTELRELEIEAKKSGALPGWLRAQSP